MNASTRAVAILGAVAISLLIVGVPKLGQSTPSQRLAKRTSAEEHPQGAPIGEVTYERPLVSTGFGVSDSSTRRLVLRAGMNPDNAARLFDPAGGGPVPQQEQDTVDRSFLAAAGRETAQWRTEDGATLTIVLPHDRDLPPGEYFDRLTRFVQAFAAQMPPSTAPYVGPTPLTKAGPHAEPTAVNASHRVGALDE